MTGGIKRVRDVIALCPKRRMVRAQSDDVRDLLTSLDLAEAAVTQAHAALATERERAEAAEAERARLREAMRRQSAAVRMHQSAREQMDAHDQATLRSLAGEDRAHLIEETAAARRERDDWNARATALESDRDAARAEADALRAECERLGAALRMIGQDNAQETADLARLHALVACEPQVADLHEHTACVVAEVARLRERVIDAEAEASRWGDALVAIGDALGMPGAGSAEIVAAVRELVGCQ